MSNGWGRLQRYKKRLVLVVLFVFVVLSAVTLWLVRPSANVVTHTYEFKKTQPTPLAELSTTKLPLQKNGASYSAKSTDGAAVSFSQQYEPGKAFTTVSAAGASLAISIPDGDNPQPVIKDSSVSMNGIKDGVNLAYQNYQDHLKEEITLTKPVMGVSFFFSTQNVSQVSPDAAGGLIAYDSSNSPVFYFEPLTAKDTDGQDITFKYTLRKSDSGYAITVSAADQQQLESAHFPVVIDPTISWSFSLASDYTISNFAKLQVSGNVASLINNSGYATDNPYLYTNNPLPYATLSGFSEVLDVTNQGTIGYQFSKDKTTWYWWDGSTWTIAAPADYNQSNPAATVNANIASFATQLGGGNLYTKAFFHASSTATPTALNSFTVTYAAPPPAITSASPANGIVAGGTNVTITGTNFTATPSASATFATAVNYTGGSTPYDVALADFNNDGKLDLVEANQSDTFVGVYLGTGTGTFGARTNVTTDTGPVALVTGDFNTDGKMDIATANKQFSTISVLIGTGTGTFATRVNYAATNPSAIATADFNGDGKLDLAVTDGSGTGTQVGVYLGTGTGTFGARTNFTVGTNPASLAVGDFNKDGKQDIATANDSASNSLSVLIGLGTGSFAAKVDYPIAGPSSTIKTADLNSDGKLDLVASSFTNSNVAVLLGTGTGTFGTKVTYPVSAGPRSMSIGDFNADGKPDLVAAATSFGTISVLIGTGTGTFGTKTDIIPATSPWGSTTGDINADGKVDMVMANNVGTVSVYINTTSQVPNVKFGGVAATNAKLVNSTTITANTPAHTAGTLDVLVTNFDGQTSTLTNGYTYNPMPGIAAITPSVVPKTGGNTVTITGSNFVNGATVTFGGVPANVTYIDANTLSIVTSAHAGSTYDVVVTNPDTQSATVVNGITFTEAAPTFSSISPNSGYTAGGKAVTLTGTNFVASPLANFGTKIDSTTGATPYAAVTGDFNKDGKMDMATANGASTLSVFLGNNDGTFAAKVDYATGTGPQAIVTGDFNRDGKLDLVTANTGANNVSILLGTGTGTFGAKSDFQVMFTPRSIAAGDFNGDSNPDLVTTGFIDGAVGIQLGQGNGAFGVQASYTASGGANGVAVGDFNGDSKQDIAVTNLNSNTISVFIGTGTGTLGTKVDYPMTAPTSIVAADFNGDNKIDLAATDNTNSAVSILIGSGTGTFAAKVNYPTGPNPRSMLLGDFNKDAKPDLAVANNGASTVSVLLGTGTGTFGTKVDYPVAGNPFGLGSGDINGDGRTDLVAANNTVNIASVLLNTSPVPNVTFGGVPATNVQIVNPTTITAMTPAHAGGPVDVVETNYDGQSSTLANGYTFVPPPGTFTVTPSNVYRTGGDAVTLSGSNFLNGATVTINGVPATSVTFVNANTLSVVTPAQFVGTYTVVVTNPDGQSVTLSSGITYINPPPVLNSVSPNFGPALGNGSTTLTGLNFVAPLTASFAANVVYPLGGIGHSVTSGDFNADGKPDMVATNQTTNSISLFLGTGTGTYGARTDFATNGMPNAVTSGDFNKDGKMDIVAVTNGSFMGVFLGNGTGGFATRADYAVLSNAIAVTSGDFNKDGNLDFVTANQSGFASVFIGSAAGTFAAKVDYPITGGNTSGIATADLNNDTKLDLVTTSGTTVSVLLGTGTGTFGTKTDTTVGNSPSGVAIGDFNGDGKPDLAVGTPGDGTVNVLLGTGTGSFAPRVTYPGVNPRSIVAGDFNHDGTLDLAAPNGPTANSTSIYIGRGDGTFFPKVDLVTGTAGSDPNGVVISDPNLDGKQDLLVASRAGNSVSVLLNSTAGPNVTFGGVPATASLVSSTSITVKTPPHAAGVVDITMANPDGQGTALLGSYTYIAPPTVASVTPARVFKAGGDVVTITGTDFRTLPTVTFGGTPATSVTFINSTTLSVVTPPRPQGLADIVVTDPDGQAATLAGSITFLDPAPTLTTISPTGGLGTGGTPVTLTGTNFTSSVISFDPPTSNTTGATPIMNTAADFNADGKMDMATANYTGNSVSVFLGTGTGTFGTKTDFATGSQPRFIASGDFNADGKLDMVVANGTSATVSVLLGTGTGTFATQVTYPTNGGPTSVAVSDFNADGKLDLITVSSSSFASVLLGTGTGTFGTKTDFAIGSGSSPAVTTGDFNKDGKQDLAVTNESGNTVSILIGTGTGTFAAKVDYATGLGPVSIATGDFNKDGNLDLATDNGGTTTVSVLLGTGTGTFGTKVDYAIGIRASALSVTDINRDGKPDIVTGNNGSVSVLLGTGTGTFGTRMDFPSGTGINWMTTADFNNDSLPDIAVTGGSTVKVLLNTMKLPVVTFAGASAPATNIVVVSPTTITANTPYSTVGGLTDVTVTQYDAQFATLGGGFSYAAPPAITGVLPGIVLKTGGDMVTITGTTFTPTSTVAFGGVPATSVTYVNSTTLTAVTPAHAYGPVNVTVTNPDGQIATAVNAVTFADATPTITSVTPNTGATAGGTAVTITGTNFTAAPAGAASFATKADKGTGTNPRAVATADFNADGKLDAAVTNLDTNNVSILLGNGTGGFANAVNYATGIAPTTVVTGDFNADSKTDLAIANTSANTVSVLLGTGTGTFAAKVDYGTGTGVTSVTTGDFNGDNKLDLASTNFGSGTISILLGTGTGTFATKVDYTVGDGMQSIIKADVNADGKLDLIIPDNSAHAISVLLGTGTGTFAAKVNYATGTSPRTAVTGDFNKDGKLDVATANNTSNTVSVLIGSGTGTFAAKVDYPTGTAAYGITAADLNKDGNLDIATTSNSSSLASVLIGTGTGTFGVKTDYTVAATAYGVTNGDFNADGRLDLVSTSATAGGVSVLLNTTPPLVNLTIGGVAAVNPVLVNETTITATTPAHTAGGKNVVLTNADGQTATKTGGFTYFPDKYGVLTPALNVRETEPGAITLQAQDLAGNPVTSGTDLTLSLATSSTTGFFARSLSEDISTRWNYNSVILPAGASQVTFYYKDNLKGSPIITVTGAGPLSPVVQQTQRISSKYRMLVTGVTNPVRGGIPSSLTIQAVDYTGTPLHDYTGTVHFTTTDGAAVIPPNYQVTPGNLGGTTFVNGVTMVSQGTWCVTATDTVDPDITGSQCGIVVSPPNSGTISKLAFITPGSVFPADGQTSAITVQTQDSGGSAVPVTANKTVYLYSDSGTGQFSLDGTTWSGSGVQATVRANTTAVTFYYRDATIGQHHITAADDATPGVDFAWTNAAQTESTGVGSAHRLKITPIAPQAAGEVGAIHISQQDTLGNDVPALGAQTVYVTSNSGAASFSYTGDYSTGSVGTAYLSIPAGDTGIDLYYRDPTAGLHAISASDATPPNGDTGLLDDSEPITVTTGPPAALTFTTPPAQVVAGALSQTVTVGLNDQFGNLVTTPTDRQVYVSATQPGATFYNLSGTQVITSVTVPAGQSTASFTFKQTQYMPLQTITASDNAAAPDGTAGLDDVTQNEVITTGAGAKYVITSSAPAPTPAGIGAGPLTVSLENQYGVVIPSNGSSPLYMHSTSSGGSFSLDGTTYTTTIAGSLPDNQSSQTFYYKDTASGTATITVADEASGADVGLTNDTQNISIAGGAPATLRVTTSPQSTQAGQVSNPATVRVEDQFGNVTTAASHINLSLSSNSGTMRFDNNSAGTFNGTVAAVTIFAGQQQTSFYYKDTVVGTPQISVGGSGLTGASQTETVTAGAVAKLGIAGAGTTSAGQPSGVVTVSALNAYDAPVAVAEDTVVNLTSSAGTGRFDTAVAGAFNGSITSVTIPAGQQTATFYYKDTVAGTPVISAASTGLTTVTQTETVLWGAVAAVELSGGSTATAGQPSGTITASAFNAYGIRVPTQSNLIVNLSSEATTGRFDTNYEGLFNGSITSVTIPTGQQTATFYYKDTAAGTPQINASGSGFTTGTQTETVGWGALARIALSDASTATAGQSSAAASIDAFNAYNIQMPVPVNTVVSLNSSAATGRFDTSAAGAFDGSVTYVTIPAGQSSAPFYYQDTLVAAPTITAIAGALQTTRSFTISAAAPTQLQLTTSPQSTQAGQTSTAVVIRLQDQYGNVASSAGNTAVDLTSTSGTLRFDTNINGPFSGSITTVNIPNGQTTVGFYYKDTVAGTPQISMEAAGLSTATQTETVDWGAITKIAMDGASTVTAGQVSGVVNVTTQNAYNTPVAVASDTSINLVSNAATGRFDTASGGPFNGSITSVTIPAGQSSTPFYYRDTVAGAPVITANDGSSPATRTMTVSADTISKLGITTPPRTLEVSQTGGFTVALQDQYGNAVTRGSDTVIDLSTSSLTGQFRNAQVPITSLTIAAGSSTGTFQYVDTSTGTPSLGVSTAGLNDGSQTATIIYGAPASFTLSAVNGVLTAGQPSAQLTVTAVNAYSQVIPVASDLVVNLTSTSPSGKFDAGANGSFAATSITIPSGSFGATFYYKDTVAGSPTISAAHSGINTATFAFNVSAGAPVSFAFLTPARSTVAGVVSESITVGLRDQFGNTAVAPSAIAVSMADSGGSATLSTSAGGPWTDNPLSVTIPTGNQNVTFYYQDTQSGNKTLAASAGGLVNGTQSTTVVADEFTHIGFSTNAQTIAAKVPSSAITIVGLDQYENQSNITYKTGVFPATLRVNLTTGSVGGEFSMSNDSWSSTTYIDIPYDSGPRTFYYKDSVIGATTLMADDVNHVYPAIGQNVTVTAGTVSKLKFDSSAQNIIKDTPSQLISVSLADQFNYVNTDSQNHVMHLISSSAGGEFSVDSTTWSSTLDIDYAPADTTKQFYYRDSLANTATITASSPGLASGSQLMTVIPGVISKVVTTMNAQVTAGQTTNLLIQTTTSGGLPAAVDTGTTVRLSSVSGGQFSLSNTNWEPVTQVTIPAGQYQLSLFYRNTAAGSDTVTAAGPVANAWADGTSAITVSAAAATKLVLVAQPGVVTVGVPSTAYVAQAQDQFGNLIIASFDRTLYLFGPATGRFATDTAGPWNVTSVKILAGTGGTTFYYSDTLPGGKTLTVSDTGNAAPDTQLTNIATNIYVASLPPSKLEFTSGPQTITAGQKSGGVVITAVQSNGDPAVLGGPMGVSLSSNNAGGAFYDSPESNTPISAINIPLGGSSVTVYFKSNLAGASTITASGGGVTPDQQALAVNPDTPVRLRFLTAPQTKTVGVDSGQMRIALQDQYGNPAPATSDVPISLTSNSPTGTFSAQTGAGWDPLSATTIATGSSDLYFYYRDTTSRSSNLLVQTTTSGIDLASQTFTASAGAATRLRFVSAPQSTQAGQTSTVMNVQLQDQYGNVASNPTDLQVHLSSSTASALFSSNDAFTSTFTQVVMPAGSGQTNFYYKDMAAGAPVITAGDFTAPDSPDLGLMNATQAQTVTAGAADHLRLSGSTSLTAGQGAPLTIHLENAYGIETTSLVDTTLHLSASGGGQFSPASDFSSTLTSVTLPQNTSSLQIYYRNTAAGVSTIKVTDQPSGPDVGLLDSQLTIAVLPAAIARIGFMTTAPNVEAGQTSNAMSVQTQDVYGNLVLVPSDLQLVLSSDSAGGRFSTDNGFVGTTTQVTIAAETATATFYYRDVTVGSPIITVADSIPALPDTGLANASQTATVTAGAVTKVAWLPPPAIEAGEAIQLTMQSQNAYGVATPVDSDVTMHLDHTTTGSAGFSAASGGPWTLPSVTLPAGQSNVTVYYRSPAANDDVLTAADTNPAMPDTGLTNATLNLGVVAGTPTQLTITTPAFNIDAHHTSPVLVAQTRNAHGAAAPVTDTTQLYLRTTSPEGEFAATTSGPWGINYVAMPQGQSTVGFYYHDPTVGTPTVTLTDNLPITPDTGMTNDSQLETIGAQTVDHLFVTNISTPQTQGSPSSIVVQAQDSAGYIISDYAGTITFSSSDADAIIPGEYTFDPNVDKGIHTFTNAAAFLSGGTKSVTVTDTDGLTGTQSNIIVNGNTAGPIAALQFVSPSPPLTVNKDTASGTMTIQSVDADGKPSNAPPGGYPVRLTSSSAGGKFATSPSGPWLANLTATIPANLNTVNVYYQDSAVGTPVVHASDWVGGVDDAGIVNASLQVLVRTLKINVTTTLQMNNNSHYYEVTPILFSKNSNGDYFAQADFATAVTDTTTGTPVTANLLYTLRDPDSVVVATQTALAANYTYHIQPIQGIMKAGNWTLTVTAKDSITGITGSQTVNIPMSGWKMVLAYDPNNKRLGIPLPYTVATYHNGQLADAPNFSVHFRDDNGTDVPGVDFQYLNDLTRTGTGQYSGSIPTTGLQASVDFSNAYYLYSRIFDTVNQTQAEDNHFDIFFQNDPTLAPKNFGIEKVVTNTPGADETYNLKFKWDSSPGANTYVLYRTQNKNATLYTDPCTIFQVQTGHRYGDTDSRLPFCEVHGQQDVGTDDTAQWVEMARVSAPALTTTIPWAQLQTDQPGSTYYYLVRAENGAGAAGYSTMAVSSKKHFTANTAPLTSINWLSLPYYTGNVTEGTVLTAQRLAKASDIVKDIEGGTGNGTNQKVSRVAIWSPGTQIASSFYSYNTSVRRWTGTDFTVSPGDSVYLQASKSGGFDWTVVGTDVTLPFSLLANGGALTNFNWVSIPYTGKYQKASDVVKDIEGSITGVAGNDKNRYINRVAIWSDTSQIASSFYNYNTAVHRWTGNDFPIRPGDGVYIQLSGGGLPLIWVPQLIINPYN